MTDPKNVPTLLEWAGGLPAIEHLTEVFYSRVEKDPELAPVFARMSADHPQRVAKFIAEVLGGPPVYTDDVAGGAGGHPRMVARHLGRMLDESQRTRWIRLLLECADEVGLPSDPEFRSAFVGYLEWGSRLAVLNSHTNDAPPADSPMPKWNWGPPGGPYVPGNENTTT